MDAQFQKGKLQFGEAGDNRISRRRHRHTHTHKVCMAPKLISDGKFLESRSSVYVKPLPCPMSVCMDGIRRLPIQGLQRREENTFFFLCFPDGTSVTSSFICVVGALRSERAFFFSFHDRGCSSVRVCLCVDVGSFKETGRVKLHHGRKGGSLGSVRFPRGRRRRFTTYQRLAPGQVFFSLASCSSCVCDHPCLSVRTYTVHLFITPEKSRYLLEASSLSCSLRQKSRKKSLASPVFLGHRQQPG